MSYHILLIESKQFDFICMQETHCKDNAEALLWGQHWGGGS